MQALFLPTVAIAFAAAPVAGQNFGAGLGARVRQTFYSAAAISAAIMFTLTLLREIAPAGMIRFFNADPGFQLRPSYFAAVRLPLSSTRTSSKGLSPVFSGKCLPAASHCVAPAFIGAS